MRRRSRADASSMPVSTLLAAGWLVAWLVIFVLYLVRRAGSRALLRHKYGKGSVPRGWGIAWRAIAPAALLVAASACLILVFGQFRLDRRPIQGTVILAVDVSESMDATDVRPNRLEAAKAAATSFLHQLPQGFHVGVVTFAGSAEEAAEPSEDRDRAATAIAAFSSSRGTVIGDGLAEALDAIEADWTDHGRRPAAVVLLSDGADTGSQVSPDEATARARSLAVPVFTVAIVGEAPQGQDGSAGSADGSEGGDPGQGQSSDTALLERIADSTGGQPSTASTADELTEVYDTLGVRLSGDLAVGSSALPLLVAAVALTALAIILFLAPSRPR
jgi:Ca-activated chloride channel family protein